MLRRHKSTSQYVRTWKQQGERQAYCCIDEGPLGYDRGAICKPFGESSCLPRRGRKATAYRSSSHLWNNADLAEGYQPHIRTYQPLDTEVKINSKGEIDCLLNAADVCKTLGLVGDGIGQAGGVRSPDGLLGAGIAIFGSRIKLSHLNPPDATSTVEVRLRTEKKQRAQKI